MKPLALLLSICIISFSTHAERGQSIMFGDPDPISHEKTRNTANVEHSEHCKELRRQMDELKGKPQRRHAVVERYKLECQPPANR